MLSDFLFQSFQDSSKKYIDILSNNAFTTERAMQALLVDSIINIIVCII